MSSDRRFRFDVDRDRVWAAIVSVDRYQDWWPWLVEFDGSTFCAGATWRCVVKPPVPYSLRFELTLRDIVDGESVSADIDGDIRGEASLTAVDRGSGCELRLTSELSAERGAVRLVTRFAGPIARLGHDWVLDNGVRQFRRAEFT